MREHVNVGSTKERLIDRLKGYFIEDEELT